jgi:hypothetical protein
VIIAALQHTPLRRGAHGKKLQQRSRSISMQAAAAHEAGAAARCVARVPSSSRWAPLARVALCSASLPSCGLAAGFMFGSRDRGRWSVFARERARIREERVDAISK